MEYRCRPRVCSHCLPLHRSTLGKHCVIAALTIANLHTFAAFEGARAMKCDRATRRSITLIGIDKNTDSALLNRWHWTGWIRLRIWTTGERLEETVGRPLAWRSPAGRNVWGGARRRTWETLTSRLGGKKKKKKSHNTLKHFIVFTDVGSYKPHGHFKQIKLKSKNRMNCFDRRNITTNGKTRKKQNKTRQQQPKIKLPSLEVRKQLIGGGSSDDEKKQKNKNILVLHHHF